jgi:phosphoglycolate phosphatase
VAGLSEIAVILFDLDGVLVDSQIAIPRSINFALERQGFAARAEDSLVRFIGAPLRRVFRELLEAETADPEVADRCIESYRERYRTASLEETHLIPNIEAMLRRLTEEHVLAVVTSKPEIYARPILDRLGIVDCFVEIFGPCPDHGQQEDKTATLARGLRALGIAARPLGAPPSAAIVGDRHFDVAAGRALGLVTVGVSWGVGSVDELEGAGVDHLVESPDELTQLFAL